jgi:uncharacterized membrane protein
MYLRANAFQHVVSSSPWVNCVIQHKLLKAIPLLACANFACTQFQASLNDCA